MKNKKYKIISEEVIKNLVEFLDEIQFDAAKSKSTEDMHKVNFCSWVIKELLNSYDGYIKEGKGKKPSKKSRDTYVEETFMDWNLPEMTDEEYEKLVDQFDAFLRGWEKEYYKDNPKKKPDKDRKDKNGDDWKPKFEDIAQHCSLDEIRDMLLDDPELTPEERFDLYYEEHERVNRMNKKKEKTYTLKDIMKKTGIEPPEKN